MKILLTGGGSGGHIMPILAIVEKIKEIKNEGVEFLFLGPNSEFNKSISDAGIQIKIIKAGKLRRYFSWENFTDTFKIIIGFFQSLFYIYKFKPDVVFSKGGFASIPPVVASYILKVPILTHESDITPGLANKIISRFADKIFISFEDTKKYFPNKKVIFTGNPIREDLLSGDKNKARESFNLKENLPTILIFGGSQGARKINKIILESLPNLLEQYQVIHICGDKNYEEIKNARDKKEPSSEASELGSFLSYSTTINRYKIYPFLTDKLKNAYALCDIIISRAGANSLSEIMALEKPSIIIPLPTSANNHQLRNAKFFAEKELVILVEEENLSVDILTEKLSKILQEISFRANMTEKINIYNSNKKDATKLIVGEIIKFH